MYVYRSCNDLKAPGATALAPSLACLTGLMTLGIGCVCACQEWNGTRPPRGTRMPHVQGCRLKQKI